MKKHKKTCTKVGLEGGPKSDHGTQPKLFLNVEEEGKKISFNWSVLENKPKKGSFKH